MEALKKAYAEIILNTAKEAAARALESERKALRFHHDLCNTKDEAIRMLLRFKQMIDIKTTEAETRDLNQQKRIEDLDAQLNETEGVIVDLRAEVRNAHERLEEMKNSHIRVSKDQTVKTQRLPNSFRYAQSTHKLSRFYHEKLNLKEKSSKSDAKLTENSACTLRRSIRKRKVRYWDEISSLLKPRASLSRCKKYSINDTKLLNDSVVKKHEIAACDTDNNRCLKYTFSRRHKKVLSSKSDNCSSHGKSVLTGQVSEKPSFNHDSEKPNLIEDSSESSDNQNMIDIACQNVVGEGIQCLKMSYASNERVLEVDHI
ncbi:hypothetical protein L1987_34452 [Smallanthus sonchifolius]|uniref:Uncharacterized protein n=1 Tax=Smallanthus sonchifolius TaxID=185202 RepID=A0ACB9HTK2_9ASTR|nr:hypothetical protein L1987_34452 [Smallanthus sonchifolius]